MSPKIVASLESSPASFHTAAESDESHGSTAATSPLQTQRQPFRHVRPLPQELKAHGQIFLEEQLYSGAINLFSSLLAAGSWRRRPAAQTVFVPPPSHLAVICTLTVHPAYTNRADGQSCEVAALALSYLRSLVAAAGPVNANLRTAFQFRSTPSWRSRRRPSYYNSDDHLSDTSLDDDDDEHDRDRDRVGGHLASENSVWSRGQDFWSTVGWAFNCSVLHPQRWRYWRPWLDFMLHVLEADWTERERLDLETYENNGGTGPKPTTMRQQSILVMYMEQKNGPQGGFKAVMKALFADGGSLSASSFHEVFEKEPRGRRSETAKKRKRNDRVDLKNDQFSDYLDDDPFMSGVSEPPTPEKPRGGAGRKSMPWEFVPSGLAETIPLRLRLLQLLATATATLRGSADVDCLYGAYASALKVAPLGLFAVLVSQRGNPLQPDVHVAVLKQLLRLVLPSSGDRRDLETEADAKEEGGEARGRLTTAMLEHCYVAQPANTVGVDDNAKLSLAVEAAIQILWAGRALEYSESLAGAVHRGVEARRAKSGIDARGARVGRARKVRMGRMEREEDELAVEVLEASGSRLGVLLEAIRCVAGGEEAVKDE